MPEQDSTAPHRSAAEMWIYIVMCQIGWFVCVLGAAHGLGWPGMLFAGGTVVFHLARIRDGQREARFIAAAVTIGWLWETALVHTGLLVYPGFEAGVAPYWLAGLWAMFAIQFNILLTWLRQRLLLAAVLGAVAAPMSFRAGAALGAVQFTDTAAALGTLAAGWALLTPALLLLAQRWDGVNAAQRFENR